MIYYKYANITSINARMVIIMKKAARIINIITIILTVFFFGYSAVIGGDAVTGFDAPEFVSNFIAGEYYVANHGIYTRVTHAQWILSFVITVALCASFITAVVLNVIAMFKKQSGQAID